MTHYGLADALYAQSDVLEDPIAVCQAVKAFYGDDWSPVSEAEVRENYSWNESWLDKRSPEIIHWPRWKWLFDSDMHLMRAFLAYRSAPAATHLIEATRLMGPGSGPLTPLRISNVIRLNVDAHLWHIERQDADPWAERRAIWLDIAGRMLLASHPDAMDRAILEAPVSLSYRETAAAVIRRRRAKCRLSQAALAQRIGASRSSLSRWELGRCLPLARYRPALRHELGGQLSDYGG